MSIAKRIVTSVIAVSITLYGLTIPWASVLLFSSVATGAMYEYVSMLRTCVIPRSPEYWIALASPMVMCMGTWIGTCMTTPMVWCVLASQIVRAPSSDRMRSAAYATTGIMYVAWPCSLAIAIQLTHGYTCLLMAMVCTWTSDSCAMLVGKMMGRTKAAPHISPNKTVEGVVGGIVCSALAMCVMHATVCPVNWSLMRYIATGALLGAATCVGDLVESVIKRVADVKDSGTCLPGHGGILDRIDGLMLSVSVMYMITRL